MMDARRDLIDTKQQQLSAVVNAYQALGGGLPPTFMSQTAVILPPLPHLSGPPPPAVRRVYSAPCVPRSRYLDIETFDTSQNDGRYDSLRRVRGSK